MAGDGFVTTLTNIVTAPAVAFRSLRAQPTALLPIILIIIAIGSVSLLYYTWVDIAWFRDYLLQTSIDRLPADIPPSQQEQMRMAFGRVSPTTMGITSAVSSAIFIPLIIAIGAAYFFITAAIGGGEGLRFRHWFSLLSWCSVPAIFGMLASAINILLHEGGQMPPEQMNPLSIASLLALDPGGRGILGRILSNLDLTNCWSVALTMVGYRAFTGRSLLVAAAIVLAPPALILGLVLVFAGS